MIKEIKISTEFNKILLKELKLSVNRLKRQTDNENYKSLLLDFILSVQESIKLIKRGKIVFGMQIMRTAFEIFLMYFAIKENKNFEERYINLSDTISQVDIRKKASIKTLATWEELYNSYNFLCEFSHTTIIRNMMINLENDNKDKEFLMIQSLFNINSLIVFYLLELDNLYKKDKINLEIYSIFTFIYMQYIFNYIKNNKDNEARTKRYEKLINIEKNQEYIDNFKSDIKRYSEDIKEHITPDNIDNLQDALKQAEKTFKYNDFTAEIYTESSKTIPFFTPQ